jgi:hypothetical protein
MNTLSVLRERGRCVMRGLIGEARHLLDLVASRQTAM